MKSSLRALLFATLSLSSSHALADGLDSVFNDTINSVTEAINEAYHPDSSDASDDRRYDESRTRYDERRTRLEERHRQLDERQRRLDEERRRLEEEEQRLEDDDYR
ncbi:DDRRRQL repeat protein YjdP [Cronobacter sakazakii]|uniref:DDRRRQL repeat protein YjdP n=1 Tax=Cronobacter sakazakii TaxID=28141 RepID=UPI002DBDE2F1|nr:DDRRRQL repeat protein YjdP [Cronobacter sakazakii]MEB8629620.1 DDRRRQL repeat protein YjdP [Cronobacter sakazakii]